LGVAIKYNNINENKTNIIVNENYSLPNPNKTKINVGIIGLGNFFMSTILPAIKKNLDKYNILALANRSNMKLLYFSKKLNAKIITTNYLELFKNTDVDLIIATPRHNLHFDLIKNSINFNKNIFIEKPLCINKKELEEIKNLIKNASKLPLINIGFNRRFAKMTKIIKDIVKDQEKPIIINYVVNSENFDKTM